ncbi:putative cyclase [Pholiota conissans]|uniref:Cyclase n=1 Tax=Pholiota conissans TaxID=109636 RepID=A0A9P5ZFL8_9AGAR|nr:putative cyclase [Pholiota conissans]
MPSHFIDLSHPLDSQTQIYPSDPTFTMSPHATHTPDGYSVHRLNLGTHTGTHIDAPYHFVASGATIESITLSTFVGEPLIIDLSSTGLKKREKINWTHLSAYAPLIAKHCIVLINTGWSKAYYQTPTYLEHPYLSAEVAVELLSLGVRLVGTDTLNPDETPAAGVAEGPDGFGFHEKFLGAGGIIAENLTNLEELLQVQQEGGKWIVNLVPLRLVGADGSPVRAFACKV